MTDAPPENPLWKYFNPYTAPVAPAGCGHVHHFGTDDENQMLVTMINTAIAIGRPLLLTGPAGSGKSSVARAVAALNRWERFEAVVTSRMEADPLKAETDEVQRLADAAVMRTTEGDLKQEDYLRPGLIWQALNPKDAKDSWGQRLGEVPPKLERAAMTGRVLLIDEIDKGDIDFANDLLDVFDEGRVSLPRLKIESPTHAPANLLVVITSNEDKEFSAPFRRRCIAHQIEMPPLTSAPAIGKAVLHGLGASHIEDATLEKLAEFAKERNGRLHVSYFVDLIKAASRLLPDLDEDAQRAVIDAIQRMMAARRKFGSA